MNNLHLIEEYWKPYLSQLQNYEYCFKEDHTFGNTVMLQSPFLNAPYDLPIEELQMLKNVDSALSRKTNYDINIEKDDIKSIGYAIFSVEKNFRRDYFYHNFLMTNLSKKFTDEDIWNLIIEVWSESEFNCSSEHARESWREIFKVRDRPLSLTRKLPNKFQIYRGGTKEGYSWTRDIEVARWFQNRTNLVHPISFLLKTTVHKDDVLFHRNEESEIVVCPDSLISMWNFNDIETLSIGND